MKKFILGLVAAAAIASPIAMAASANAATTDVNGVVNVSKGEIMAQFPGMNEAAFQKIAMAPGESLTGSDVTTVHDRDHVRTAQTAASQHHYRNTIRTTPIDLHRGLQRLGQQDHRLDHDQGRADLQREQHRRQPLPVVHLPCGLRGTSPRSTCGPRPCRRASHTPSTARPSASWSTRTWPRPSDPPHDQQQPVPLRRGGLFSFRPGPAGKRRGTPAGVPLCVSELRRVQWSARSQTTSGTGSDDSRWRSSGRAGRARMP